MTEQNPKEIKDLFKKDYSKAMDLRGHPLGIYVYVVQNYLLL